METEVKKFGAEVKRLTARERAALSDFLVYLNSLAESMVSPRSMLAVACYAISCLNNTHMAVLVTRHLGQLHGSSSMFVIRDIFALRISAAVKPFRRLHTLPLLFLKIFYLDRLDRGPIQWDVFPRIKVWSMQQIGKAAKSDKLLSGDYGKLGLLDVAYGEQHPRDARDSVGPLQAGVNNMHDLQVPGVNFKARQRRGRMLELTDQ